MDEGGLGVVLESGGGGHFYGVGGLGLGFAFVEDEW